jgi:hypothetical protein
MSLHACFFLAALCAGPAGTAEAETATPPSPPTLQTAGDTPLTAVQELDTCEKLIEHRANGGAVTVQQAMEIANCFKTPDFKPGDGFDAFTGWQGFTASRPPGTILGDPFGLTIYGGSSGMAVDG